MLSASSGLQECKIYNKKLVKGSKAPAPFVRRRSYELEVKLHAGSGVTVGLQAKKKQK